MSIWDLAASARNSGSSTIFLNAARSAATRSAGTPGAVTNGRPISPVIETSSNIDLTVSLGARSIISGTVRQVGVLEHAHLHQRNDLPFPHPIGLACLPFAPGIGAAA